MLDSNACYICLILMHVIILGPCFRCQKIFKALKIGDINKYDHIFNPVGLDIGSESPEEIALSILSEIITFRNNRAGGFLREKGKVHQFVFVS
jgi:xanthine dehydrogenase accessory factor